MEEIIFVALANRLASREARAVNLTNISFIDRLDSGLVYAVQCVQLLLGLVYGVRVSLLDHVLTFF